MNMAVYGKLYDYATPFVHKFELIGTHRLSVVFDLLCVGIYGQVYV